MRLSAQFPFGIEHVKNLSEGARNAGLGGYAQDRLRVVFVIRADREDVVHRSRRIRTLLRDATSSVFAQDAAIQIQRTKIAQSQGHVHEPIVSRQRIR